MSIELMDAARDDFYNEIYAQANKEAVANFTAERLRSYYDKEPTIAEKPFKALAEARQLLQTPHQTAAFTLWLHKKRAGHAPSTFNCRVKPAFLLTHELSFPVGLAPLPALSPHRCKQSWYNARGEGLR